jgi:hypothetical protein
MSHFIGRLLLCGHPFLTVLLISFFLHHGINQIVLPPRKSTFDSQMLCPRQSRQRFSRCSLAGATLENKTTLPVFFLSPRCATNRESSSKKICPQPWWMRVHLARIQSMNRTPWFGRFRHYATPWHHQGKVPWPSDRSGTTSFKKNHPFPPELVKSVNLRKHTLGGEKQGQLSSCQLWSLASSTTIEGKRQGVGQGVYIVVKIEVSPWNFTYFDTKMSQNTHLFSCHLSQCRNKHTTIN